MIQRNLEERVYFVIKLSGNSPISDWKSGQGPGGRDWCRDHRNTTYWLAQLAF